MCVFSGRPPNHFCMFYKVWGPLWSNKMVSRNLNCCYLSLSQIYAERLLRLTDISWRDTFCSSRPRTLGEEVFTEARCGQWNKKPKQNVCEQNWQISEELWVSRKKPQPGRKEKRKKPKRTNFKTQQQMVRTVHSVATLRGLFFYKGKS